MGKQFNHVQQSDFDRVKKLLRAGLSGGLVREITGRSHATIGAIRRSSDYAEYKQRQHDYAKSRSGKTQPVDDAPRFTMDPETEVISAIEDIDLTAVAFQATLDRIADGIERLANAWEAAPKKNRLF